MADQPPRPRRRRAVAIRYNTENDTAPKVVAKGAGHLAERIIQVANESKVHVHEDPELVAVLSKLDIDTQIPENLYRAVAEILAFVYRLNNKLAELAPPKKPRPRG